MDYEKSRKFQRILTQLKDNAIMELTFCDREVSDDYYEKFQEILANNTSLECLTCSLFRSKAVTAIADALKLNSSLTSLNIVRDVNEYYIGYEGALLIAETLKMYSSLTSLTIRENKIGDMGVFAISEALKVNSFLTSLDLGDTFIRYEGALAIAESLKVNSTLTSLNMGRNYIPKEGASGKTRP